MASIVRIVYWSGLLAFLIILSILLYEAVPTTLKLPFGLAYLFSLFLFALMGSLAAIFLSSKLAYYVELAVSVFGIGTLTIFWMIFFNFSKAPYLTLSVLVAISAPILLHFFTREGLMIQSKYLYGGLGLDLGRITRILSLAIAPIVLFIGVLISFSDLAKIPAYSALTVFLVIAGIYVAFSVQGLNSAYRATLTTRLFSGRNLRTADVRQKLLAKYPNDPDSVDLIAFLLLSSIDNFVFGDYSRAFFDCYRITHDEIIISTDPRKASIKYSNANQLEEYRKIRVFLAHGNLVERIGDQREKKPITVSDVVWARENLFSMTFELLNLAFIVASEL